MPKSPELTKEHVRGWIEFFIMYWHLLDDERRDSYILDILDAKSPPAIQPIEDLEGYEDKALRAHLGRVLQKYRLQAGLKQKDVANMMKKTASYVSLIESGDKMYSTFDLLRVFHFLKIPMTELMNVHYAQKGE